MENEREKQDNKKMNLALAIFKEVHERGQKDIREHDLHQIVRRAQETCGDRPFVFISQPISYSFSLQTYLNRLDRLSLIDVIYTTEGVSYRLTEIGRAQAQEATEKMRIEDEMRLRSIRKLVEDYQQ